MTLRPVPAGDLSAPAAVTAYKNLVRVERDFRYLKADDLDLRPVCVAVSARRERLFCATAMRGG